MWHLKGSNYFWFITVGRKTVPVLQEYALKAYDEVEIRFLALTQTVHRGQ
jgi:hypothetical protein